MICQAGHHWAHRSGRCAAPLQLSQRKPVPRRWMRRSRHCGVVTSCNLYAQMHHSFLRRIRCFHVGASGTWDLAEERDMSWGPPSPKIVAGRVVPKRVLLLRTLVPPSPSPGVLGCIWRGDGDQACRTRCHNTTWGVPQRPRTFMVLLLLLSGFLLWAMNRTSTNERVS